MVVIKFIHQNSFDRNTNVKRTITLKPFNRFTFNVCLFFCFCVQNFLHFAFWIFENQTANTGRTATTIRIDSFMLLLWFGLVTTPLIEFRISALLYIIRYEMNVDEREWTRNHHIIMTIWYHSLRLVFKLCTSHSARSLHSNLCSVRRNNEI